jgi:aldose 1-epimerase
MTNTAGKYCFTHPTGKDICLYTLRNTHGTEVNITNYGAIISSFSLKMPNGESNDIVLGFDKIEDYLADAYLEQYCWLGAAVGRYANRIKNAAFEIDGKKYQLTINNNNDQLHGGHEGFDKKVWECVAQGETPHPCLELQYTSPDGEEGYPGKLEVRIRFELTNENELSYEYTATCDQATAINLTHHGYFNLNNGGGTIEDHEVKIYGSSILEQDGDFIATGDVVPVDNTGYDFTSFTPVGSGSIKAEEFDKSFVIDLREDQLVAETRSKQSGICLQVYSTEPVIHFYTGKWIPVVKGKNGNTYGPLSGLCLETQKHPNAVNIPGFANTILRPGETYHHKTTYKIIV